MWVEDVDEGEKRFFGFSLDPFDHILNLVFDGLLGYGSVVIVTPAKSELLDDVWIRQEPCCVVSLFLVELVEGRECVTQYF